MLLRSIGAALLTAGAAHAFKNSSPMLMLSTQPSAGGIESAVVNTADKVADGIMEAVGDCAQSKYFIVQQPGLTVADLHSDAGKDTRQRAGSKEYEQHVSIDNVLSGVNAEELASKIAKKCGAINEDSFQNTGRESVNTYTGEGKEVELRKLQPLPEQSTASKRTKSLEFMHSQIDRFAPKLSEDHMIIILSTPATAIDEHADNFYEMDDPYPSSMMHQDIKRDIKFEPLKNSNNTMQDGLPLFEKYQFLTPGIFMGLTVTLLLIIILWVGVSAIAGLEVSYMAFSKEMGPAAQNKGKQQ